MDLHNCEWSWDGFSLQILHALHGSTDLYGTLVKLVVLAEPVNPQRRPNSQSLMASTVVNARIWCPHGAPVQRPPLFHPCNVLMQGPPAAPGDAEAGSKWFKAMAFLQTFEFDTKTRLGCKSNDLTVASLELRAIDLWICRSWTTRYFEIATATGPNDLRLVLV